jgi:hypothetical protein
MALRERWLLSRISKDSRLEAIEASVSETVTKFLGEDAFPHRPIALALSRVTIGDRSTRSSLSLRDTFTFSRQSYELQTTLRFQVPVERRTLPTDLPGPSRRRPFTKRHSPSAEACSSGGSSGGGGGTSGSVVTGTTSGMQTSCSLPETPVFARGSDIPRTPQHAGNPTQSRRQPGWYAPTTATG